MLHDLEARRRQVLEELGAIRSLQRGTLNEQYFERARRGKPTGERRGPYYVLSRRHEGRTVSARVKPGDVARVRGDLARHERFTALCEELAELTERLGALERAQGAPPEAQKKRPKSRRNAPRK